MRTVIEYGRDLSFWHETDVVGMLGDVGYRANTGRHRQAAFREANRA